MRPNSLSTVEFLDGVRRADHAAVAQLFRDYAHRLIGLARKRLDARTLQKVDPEDVVQSVFRSFLRMSREAELRITDPDHLWNLLATITARKCSHRIRFFRAAVRDVRREAAAPGSDDAARRWDTVDAEPTPAEAALLVEAVEQMLRGLDERDRAVVTLSLTGHASTEIADRVGISRRSVQLLLQQVRRRLRSWLTDD